jgi:hypothetical protein
MTILGVRHDSLFAMLGTGVFVAPIQTHDPRNPRVGDVAGRGTRDILRNAV